MCSVGEVCSIFSYNLDLQYKVPRTFQRRSLKVFLKLLFCVRDSGIRRLMKWIVHVPPLWAGRPWKPALPIPAAVVLRSHIDLLQAPLSWSHRGVPSWDKPLTRIRDKRGGGLRPPPPGGACVAEGLQGSREHSVLDPPRERA